MQPYCCLFTTLWLVPIITIVECSWGEPSSGQYHIQTDEGPERYFRFQTDNGQFRKERRLQDGTVIGTEAWIDAAGFLRQKDYIADKKGYRILKSKTVFVGQGRQIQDAIKSTKSTPAQSGVLVDGKNGLNDRVVSETQSGNAAHSTSAYSTTPIPPPSSTTVATTPALPRLGYLSPTEAAKIEPSPYLGFDHYPDELPRTNAHFHQPIVHIHPHSEPIDDNSNSIADDFQYHRSTTTEQPPAPIPPLPSLSIEPPYESNYRRARPVAILSPTPSPITAHEAAHTSPISTAYTHRDSYGPSTPAPFIPIAGTTPSSSGYHYGPLPTSVYNKYDGDSHTRTYYATTAGPPVALPFDVNSLEGLLPPPPPVHHHRRLRPPSYSSTLSSEYQPQQEQYDGVSVTNSGFRYYMPRQYHEEEQIDEHKRAGSFGYVDPFGIRRVVYYNASPARGFVHRNNNQYVGLNAPPYDEISTPV